MVPGQWLDLQALLIENEALPRRHDFRVSTLGCVVPACWLLVGPGAGCLEKTREGVSGHSENALCGEVRRAKRPPGHFSPSLSSSLSSPFSQSPSGPELGPALLSPCSCVPPEP